ncbi:MAG: cupin domain-containing protein [Armatimonadota bacterium]|nr:cupin domain-containing protein [Armatimonadota bacterium]
MDPTSETTCAFVPDLATLADAPADSIVSRTIYKDERVKAVLFAFAPGQELSEHTASTAAIIHVLRGEARLTLGRDVRDAAAGTWVRMPPQLPHSLLAKTPVLMLLLLLQ